MVLCAGCRGTIYFGEDIIRRNGKLWHSYCAASEKVICQGCHREIANTPRLYENRPYHEHCVPRSSKKKELQRPKSHPVYNGKGADGVPKVVLKSSKKGNRRWRSRQNPKHLHNMRIIGTNTPPRK